MNIIKQLNWVAIIVHLFIIILFAKFWQVLGLENSFLFGALSYFIASFLLRTFIPHTHRLGITFIKHEEYAAAIECFEVSYKFFTENSWIDQFRSVTMLTASKVSYREMALLNIAYCYDRLGDLTKAKQTYQKIINEFPGNEMAIDSLNNLNEESNLPVEDVVAE